MRDEIGRKMSKQLGNSPDPLDLIATYGADGVRMAMLISSSAGNDVMFDEALCEQGRNFGNKIWNAYRLVNGWTVDGTLAQSDNDRLAGEWFRQTLRRAWRSLCFCSLWRKEKPNTFWVYPRARGWKKITEAFCPCTVKRVAWRLYAPKASSLIVMPTLACV